MPFRAPMPQNQAPVKDESSIIENDTSKFELAFPDDSQTMENPPRHISQTGPEFEFDAPKFDSPSRDDDGSQFAEQSEDS